MLALNFLRFHLLTFSSIYICFNLNVFDSNIFGCLFFFLCPHPVRNTTNILTDFQTDFQCFLNKRKKKKKKLTTPQISKPKEKLRHTTGNNNIHLNRIQMNGFGIERRRERMLLYVYFFFFWGYLFRLFIRLPEMLYICKHNPMWRFFSLFARSLCTDRRWRERAWERKKNVHRITSYNADEYGFSAMYVHTIARSSPMWRSIVFVNRRQQPTANSQQRYCEY